MESKQNLGSQTPEWIAIWSKYILQQFSTASEVHSDALELVQDLLLATTRGDSCIQQDDYMIQSVKDLLFVEDSNINTQVAPLVADDEYLYLYRYWHLEQRLAAQIVRLKQQSIAVVDVQPFEHLLEDQYQKEALNMVAENAFNIITGGPGTGKTYTLARIIAVLSQAIPDIRIAMAAPTGKAAQRMKEALQNSLSDQKLNELGLITDDLKQQDTLTIHRLLGLGTQSKARFNQKQPLPYDVIVIDEASMLDLNLATLLLEAVPDHCRLILLGDANQLASVDVGSVLADLQQAESLNENRVNLVNSRRFKADALIGKMAQFIQAQKISSMSKTIASHSMPLLNNFEQEIVAATELKPIQLHPEMTDVIQLEYLAATIPQTDLLNYYQKLSWGYHHYFDSIQHYLNSEQPDQTVEQVIQAFDYYRILTAIHHSSFGLEALNREMQKALFEYLPLLSRQGDWYVGRPVMMGYNDYQLGLSNGDIGVCFKHRQQKDQFEVYFPSLDQWIPATRLPKSIQTAFALTIHKSQGSEFRHTAVVLDAAATKLLSQELIYTAITRAKSAVSLLVYPEAFVQSLSIATTRQSGLGKKINKYDIL
ncbi:exodeoxyribonuclease V subunit alpha [Acinetobacter sp. ANC 4648]|uniref:exodeoxyribonuclease V subunit alpha n=1 Tax=Acinetobacter sp. ANC 4648 TaxID=1977875 RepID=UPI001BB4671C|nr:exodeoxyribonuclease V subunit alpha [Acinetobacter sp. ANC 4648]